MIATPIKTSRPRKLNGASGCSGSNTPSSDGRPPSPKPLPAWNAASAFCTARQKFAPGAPHWEPKFPLDLVIAYEDEVTRGRALSVYDDLVMELEDDHDVRHSCWQFPHLYDARTLEIAVDAALGAKMIILSLNHRAQPSRIVRAWMEGWLSEKNGRHCALVALVENAPSLRREDCPLLDYFFSAAHRAQMGFFWHVVPAPPPVVNNPLGNLSARETAL